MFGIPDAKNEQIVISPDYFPQTFSKSKIEIPDIIQDLSTLSGIEGVKIQIETHTDLRDSHGMPYAIDGKEFESVTEALADGTYKIHLANSITTNPNRLIYSLIYEFIDIRLRENYLNFDTGEDTSLFLFIAGIYFGFGIPLAQNLTDIGRADDGFWETKWNRISEMPNELMAFGLATYSNLTSNQNPEWKNELPQDLQSQFDAALEFIQKSPSRVLGKKELDAIDLSHQADVEYENGNFEVAISHLQKILFITEDELMKADTYNNIGYFQTRLGEYDKSIKSFRKAIQLDPDSGFAFDNLGYALIRIGELDDGKRQLDKAMNSENNDWAYTYRNLALYYFAKNEVDKAESNFKLAFDHIGRPVDYLDFHYAEFLIKTGKKREGLVYLEKAVQNGEHEAIKRKEEIMKEQTP